MDDKAIYPVWEQSLVRVFVEDMSVEFPLGIHPWEKGPENRQKVLVTAELFVPALPYLAEAGEKTIVNYERLRETVLAWKDRDQISLIETCLNELLETAFEDHRVEACRLSVSKPDVFQEARSAGVEVFMRRADYERLRRAVD